MSEAKGANASKATENSETDLLEEPATSEPSKEAVAAYNERVLQESKKFKERALKAEKENETLKKARLEEQGNYKAIAEDYKGKFENLSKAVVEKELNISVEREALKQGCLDVEAVLGLGNRNLLQYDPETATVHGADMFVDDLKKRKAYLFGQKQTAVINSTTPNGAVKAKQPLTPAEIAKLDPATKAKYWSEILVKR